MGNRSFALTAVALAGTVALTGCGASAPVNGSDSGAFRPKGDVKMVVPFGAGGGSDLSGRAIAAGLEEGTGVNISVENREGGSGAVGYSNFLSQKGKDNFLLAAETALLALPLTQDVQFDYKSFTPIMKLGDDYTLMVVKSDSKNQTCPDIVNEAKNSRVVAGVTGTTSLTLDQVVFTLTEQKTGAKFDRVPFESGSEAITALLGGQVDIISVNPGEALGQIQAGSIKALCSFSDKRYTSDILKDVPTAKEQGLDVSFAQFRGFIAPGGISEEAKKYWIDAAKKFESSDAYKKYIEKNMLQANAVYGDDFGAFLENNTAALNSVLSK